MGLKRLSCCIYCRTIVVHCYPGIPYSKLSRPPLYMNVVNNYNRQSKADMDVLRRGNADGKSRRRPEGYFCNNAPQRFNWSSGKSTERHTQPTYMMVFTGLDSIFD